MARVMGALLLTGLIGCAAATDSADIPAPVAPGAFEKGMVLGLFARHEPTYAADKLDELQRLGVTSVCIMIPWVIPHVRSLDMNPRDDMTPNDASLVRAIRAAHARGMSVLLMPFLYVDHMEEGEWRGTLAPPDWDAWFARYGEFVLHYARLGQAEKAAWLSIGSELCSTEAHEARWETLVGEVRRAYQGGLTYSSNWDHRKTPTFLKRLDALGMNAYFELTDDADATEDQLVAAWGRVRQDIEAWRSQVGLDIIVTEVGYPSRAGAARDPWNYDAPGPVDQEVQKRCYRAFQRAWGGDPHLRGVYFYIWWGDGGPEDTGYTPRGKPAEAVIRDWYQRSSQQQADRSAP